MAACLGIALLAIVSTASAAGQQSEADAETVADAAVLQNAAEAARQALDASAEPAQPTEPPPGESYIIESSEIDASQRPNDRNAAAAPSASSHGRLPLSLTMYAGQVVTYSVDSPLRRVAVGSGQLVEVKTLGGGELVIIANEPGNTSLHLWMRDGSQSDVPITIVDDNLGLAARVLQASLSPMSNARVAIVGGNVIVSGQDISQADWMRIQSLTKTYPSIVNLGSVDAVGMRPMVMMDVQIMEFDKNALEELGIRWDTQIDGPVGGYLKDFTTNDYYRMAPEGGAFDDLDLPLKVPGSQAFFGIATSIASRINLLVSDGKAWALASPHLSTRSGGQADFLVGGEVPIPVSSLFGQTQVEFKEYGIKLEISPVVNASRDVLTTVMAEVSRIDPSVVVAGIPGFLTRRTRSEVNVRSGQTLVISGLTDINAARSAEKFPILGNIPILGKLFRSDGFRGNRTELVVFVTPRIVTPDSPENLDGIEKGRKMHEELDADLGRKMAE
ncbi:pilus assembly protein N-terminal domain-containing protein [Lysobacter sp. F60174L2]|uniref:pilus assembly protein N-terminal domain-containing protein n=1 Tax=Lysobacter sp. F60174L2 TaxID=3459295 RepID=UPI00403DD3BF